MAAENDTLSAEEAALLASEVQEDYCSDIADIDPERQAAAMAKAAPAYGRVAAAYRVHGKAYLLYWRGLLAQCLSKEDQAVSDYAAFVEAIRGNSAYAPQLADARRRLRQLTRPPQAEPAHEPVVGGLLLGGVGTGTAVAGALLHGISYVQADFDEAARTYVGTGAEYQDGLARNRTGFALLVAGSTAAAAGFLVAAVSGGFARRVAPGRIGALLVPQPGGLMLSVGGQW